MLIQFKNNYGLVLNLTLWCSSKMKIIKYLNTKMKIVLILLGVVFIAFVIVQLFALNSQKNIETYPYVIHKKYSTFEVRGYEKTLFTSVTLTTKGYKNSSSKGFSILAGYIFGGNERNEKISMTSPVTMTLEDSMTMKFMVPKNLKKEMLPKQISRA